MRRREFNTLLGGAAAVAWPRVAFAQQPALVIGYLDPGVPETSAHFVAAFRKGLSEAGYVEGRNVTIEYRWANYESNATARRVELAADLVRRRVAVIVVTGNATALVAKAATTTIPIVFQGGGDPVRDGLVASLNRPGGNVTGVTNISGELAAKRFGLLQELVPAAARFAMLVNPNTTFANAMIAETQAAAASFGRQVQVFTAKTNVEIDAAFASVAQMRADALLVTPAVLFENRRVQVATLAVYNRMPALYASRDITEAGGLMSYGAGSEDQYRQVGIYAGRILKGEKPSDLPVMQPTKFEFVINLQTAKTLGITIPPTLLALADSVIE
jgi:putative tryptophan/tyrosine transport system substrate-binding protein